MASYTTDRWPGGPCVFPKNSPGRGSSFALNCSFSKLERPLEKSKLIISAGRGTWKLALSNWLLGRSGRARPFPVPSMEEFAKQTWSRFCGKCSCLLRHRRLYSNESRERVLWIWSPVSREPKSFSFFHLGCFELSRGSETDSRKFMAQLANVSLFAGMLTLWPRSVHLDWLCVSFGPIHIRLGGNHTINIKRYIALWENSFYDIIHAVVTPLVA